MKNTKITRENINIKYKHLILLLFGVLLLCSFSTISAANQTVDQNVASDGLTIQNNISAALANVSSGDTITINSGTYSGIGNNTNLTISTNVTIEGNTSGGAVIINAQNLSQIFTMANNINVTFINITFSNGNTTSYGGAIENLYSGTTMTFINCTFINNHANLGGAIYNNGSNMNISGSNFTNNSASGSGGAIYNTGINMSITESIFNGNIANNGGAIDSRNNASILGSNFTNNVAMYYMSGTIVMGGYGGAIYQEMGNLNITDSNFQHNNATVAGGAINAIGFNNLTISNSNFTSNIVGPTVGNDYGGGAIYLDGPTVNISNSNFNNNTVTQSANGSGGAIINNLNSNLTITNSNFTNNTVNSNSQFGGGAIFNQGNVNVSGSNFINNSAGAGAGIYNNEGIFIVTDSNFTNNTAAAVGGGVYNEELANMSIYNSNFTGNTAADGAGIINIGNMTVTGNTMSGNIASDEGNDIFNVGWIGELTLTLISGSLVDVVHGETITLTATLTDDMGNGVSYQNINFYVNGTPVGSAQVVEGSASVSYVVISAPNDTLLPVSGSYDGSGIFTIDVVEGTLDVDVLAITTINIPSNVTINQTINITGVLQNQHGTIITGINTINVTVGNQTFTNVSVDSTTGAWSIPSLYTPTTAGPVNVTVSWGGNDDYEGFTINTTFNVNKLSPNLTMNVPSTVTVGQPININGALLDQFGNPFANTALTVTVGNQTFNVTTDANGNWDLNYTPTAAGSINVAVSWEGNEIFNSLSNTTNVTVNKIVTTLTVFVPNNVTLGKAVNISAKLTDQYGNPISGATVNFYIDNAYLASGAAIGSSASSLRNALNSTNNVFIGSGITDSNGIVTISYTFNNLGTAIISAEHLGSSVHYPSSATNQTVVSTTNVSRTKTILTLVTDKNGVTATLADINGNPIPNKEITITINGKTFTGTTNSNGQVIINYPNANNYKVTAVFTGDDEYYPANATAYPDNSTGNHTSDGKAAMKKTGIPIAIVILFAIASIGLLVPKRKK